MPSYFQFFVVVVISSINLLHAAEGTGAMTWQTTDKTLVVMELIVGDRGRLIKRSWQRIRK